MLIENPYACDFIFDGNSNVCPICHHFRDIYSRNVHDLDLHNGLTTNMNKPSEWKKATSYLVAIAMFVII